MSTVLKICPYCGKQIPDGTKVCPACKRSLTLPPSAKKKYKGTGKKPERNEKPRAGARHLTRGALAVLIVSIVVMVAAIIVLATILLSGGLDYLKPDSSATGTPLPTFSVPVGGQDESASTPAQTLAPTASPTPSPTVQPTTQPTEPPVTPTPVYTVAACNDTVWVNSNDVNVRSGPGTDYTSLGSVDAGYEFSRTGTTDNGWSIVTFNDTQAFISNDLLSTTEVSPIAEPATVDASGFTDCSDTVTIGSTANIRTGPGTGYSIVDVAAVGTVLTRTGFSAHWSRVTYNGQTCYVHNNMLG